MRCVIGNHLTLRRDVDRFDSIKALRSDKDMTQEVELYLFAFWFVTSFVSNSAAILLTERFIRDCFKSILCLFL